jgi:hypothetical protein
MWCLPHKVMNVDIIIDAFSHAFCPCIQFSLNILARFLLPLLLFSQNQKKENEFASVSYKWERGQEWKSIFCIRQGHNSTLHIKCKREKLYLDTFTTLFHRSDVITLLQFFRKNFITHTLQRNTNSDKKVTSMLNKMTPSILTLPVELVYRSLDNLEQLAILLSVRDVCTRLNTITDTYYRYQVNFTVLFKWNFPHFRPIGHFNSGFI